MIPIKGVFTITIVFIPITRIDFPPSKTTFFLQITFGNKYDFSKKNQRLVQQQKQKNIRDRWKKWWKKPRRYYQKNENEKIDYYDLDIFEKNGGSTEKNLTVNLAISITPIFFRCRDCGEIFESNNKFHKHFRIKFHHNQFSYKRSKTVFETPMLPPNGNFENNIKFFIKKILSVQTSSSISIIRLSIDPNLIFDIEYSFRKFQYATVFYALTENGSHESGCLNTGCEIPMHDIEIFTKQTQINCRLKK